MNDLRKDSVTYLKIDENSHDQRVDNFLFKTLKDVPKSHIYRILRSGEVRVNSKRVDASYRVNTGDDVRIPPLRAVKPPELTGKRRPPANFSPGILYEDAALLVIDKPFGVAVHGGSGISFGVIEQLRGSAKKPAFLELVHRLDRDTSGILLLAKKRAALTGLHAALRDNAVVKRYAALVKGQWKNSSQNVKLNLHKYLTEEGERRVSVAADGQTSHTLFRLRAASKEVSLLQAELKTGRTHQIRVHLAHLGFPIAGDDKYGDFDWNKRLSKLGLKRMFLHAEQIIFDHPISGETIDLSSPLPPELQRYLNTIELKHAEKI